MSRNFSAAIIAPLWTTALAAEMPTKYLMVAQRGLGWALPIRRDFQTLPQKSAGSAVIIMTGFGSVGVAAAR
jgi:hypothetical protein